MGLTALQQAFVTALRVQPDGAFESLARGKTAEWDSVAHMELVLEIEQAFGITLTEEDVLGLDDFPSAKAILERHGISTRI
jgi:acyl carrier protein